MKFFVDSVYWFDRDKMIEHYPCLRKYGYDDSETYPNKLFPDKEDKPAYVTIESLEQLINFMKEVQSPVAIGRFAIIENNTAEYYIEIDDGYKEW